jgi:hypothetical protein
MANLAVGPREVGIRRNLIIVRIGGGCCECAWISSPPNAFRCGHMAANGAKVCFESERYPSPRQMCVV